MPYIKQEFQGPLKRKCKMLVDECDKDVGQFTFVFFYLMLLFVLKLGGECYRNYSAIVGCVQCALLEFYRSELGVYEEGKREQNGDISLEL